MKKVALIVAVASCAWKPRVAADEDATQTPGESLSHFSVDAGLEVELVVGEPDVAQPVFLTFDERGRLWVVQYRQYPFPAGLKVVGHDEYWRVKYDAFPPPPPPGGVPGADRVTIFEDTDADGIFESSRDFVTGLNIATAALPDHQGVWVMNPPYLLYYPDSNRDDVPDGDPVLHLAGFGLEDMHAVVNSLTWGPDGWIYGCQGSTCTASVTRPGIDDAPLAFQGQAIWRYHPPTRRFELFAEGGWNNFGIAVDEKWRLFTGSNGGIIGVHYVQGGYYRKHFPKHGPFTNPYTFGHVDGMADHSSKAKLSQAMAFCSAAGWPDAYRRGVLVARVLQQRIDLCEFVPEGSTYAAHERRPALSSSDKNFRPVDIKFGPDGASYIADWHEPNVTWNVTAGEGGLNPSSGRIYRLKPKGHKPSLHAFNLGRLEGHDLVKLLNHPNQWWRDTARRLLRTGERSDLVPDLVEMLEAAEGQLALESLWALHACGGFPKEPARWLRHRDPFVRLWTIRLLGDDGVINAEILAPLMKMAQSDPHPQVRSQLACSARRFPAEPALSLIEALARRPEDDSDPQIPLLLWYAVENAWRMDRTATLRWLESSPLWEAPLFRSAIVPRLGMRFTAERSDDNLKVCARLLAIAPDGETKRDFLRGMAAGLAGNTISSLPAELESALASLWASASTDTDLIEVSARLGSRRAIALAIDRLGDPSTPETTTVRLLRLLGERREASVVPPALKLMRATSSADIRREALSAIQATGLDEVGHEIIQQSTQHDEAWRSACLAVLASRVPWALLVLDAVEAGTFRASDVPKATVIALQKILGRAHASRIATHWGATHATPEATRHRIGELTRQLAEAPGNAGEGRELFRLLCGQCHTLHGEGRSLGPDLTGIDRGDRGSLLHAIVDPSASVLPDYMAFEVQLKDREGDSARTLIGFIENESSNGLGMIDVAGTRTAIAASEITNRRALPLSVMPEGLLDGLTPEQVRHLFAWLQSAPPP